MFDALIPFQSLFLFEMPSSLSLISKRVDNATYAHKLCPPCLEDLTWLNVFLAWHESLWCIHNPR